MEKVVIFGTGGFAREVHEILEYNDKQNTSLDGKMTFVGFLDGNCEMHGKEVHGVKVLGGIDWIRNNRDVGVVVAIGNPVTRRKIVNDIKKIEGVKFPNIIDSRAILGNRIGIGEGCIICANTIITTDILLKDFVIINISCTIGHDSIINDFVTISPGSLVSGNVTVGEGTDIGTGTSIIQGKSIGSWSVIGAGAIVVKDVADNVTSVGNPSKVIKERPINWHL